MTILALAALAVCASAAPAASPAAAPAKPAASVKVSTAAAAYVPASPATIYTAEKLRDPFSPGGGNAAGAGHPFSIEEFSIHNLALRGLMKDRTTDFALFVDNNYGYSLILRRGRLFDPKGKPVPGVTGKLDVKRKTATLQTADADVQVFRLGEEGED